MSSNNFTSINPVYARLSKEDANIFGDRMFNKDVILFVPTVISACIAIFFFPFFLYHYLTSNSIDKKRTRQGINDIILSYPFYYVSYFWFRMVKPLGIVISNDHVYSTRILIHWANKFGVKSFYIQHASVTKDFPVLEMSHAFLEGEDAKGKYVQAGSEQSKIELIGIPKLDHLFKRINYNKSIKVIGVASNSLEPKNAVLELILFLNKNYPEIPLIYRPHRFQYTETSYKQDFQNLIKKIPSNVIISDPFDELVADFLTKIDCLIAGESGIHLEAVLLNITSIYFFHKTEYFDDYGFVKNGLSHLAKDFVELKNIIDEIKAKRPAVRHKAKRYCFTVDSEYDGRSTDLAVGLLKQKISNKIGIA